MSKLVTDLIPKLRDFFERHIETEEDRALYSQVELALVVAEWHAASCDTRRMAETGNTDSVRSTGGAVPSEAQADAQTSPKEHP